jgi:transcriptional regulator of arginine metabolism
MKNARHEQILRLIREHEIETQEELAERLNASGFQVTQATVSRDIRQLQLVKAPGNGGRQKYAAGVGDAVDLSRKYKRVLSSAFVSMDFSMNIMVVRTVSGMAMAAAAAFDSLDWPEILGSIAGDDTIMVVLRRAEDAQTLQEKISRIMQEERDA